MGCDQRFSQVITATSTEAHNIKHVMKTIGANKSIDSKISLQLIGAPSTRGLSTPGGHALGPGGSAGGSAGGLALGPRGQALGPGGRAGDRALGPGGSANRMESYSSGGLALGPGNAEDFDTTPLFRRRAETSSLFPLSGPREDAQLLLDVPLGQQGGRTIGLVVYQFICNSYHFGPPIIH